MAGPGEGEHMTRIRLIPLAVAALAAAAIGAGAAPAASTATAAAAPTCPAGTRPRTHSPGQLAAERRAKDVTTERLLRAVDRSGAATSGCVADHELETYAEAAAAPQQRPTRQLAPYGGVLPGQKRAAVEQRQALSRNAAAVPNAN